MEFERHHRDMTQANQGTTMHETKAGFTVAEEPRHKRLNSFEPFDEIRLRVVPRLKMSELSGDEWRTSVAVDFLFKGEVVHEGGGGRDMKAAVLLLGRELLEQMSPIPMRVIELERSMCDQPGCCSKAVVRQVLKSLYSPQGDLLDPTDQSCRYYRQFCKEHANRGDCSREDCDSNVAESVAMMVADGIKDPVVFETKRTKSLEQITPADVPRGLNPEDVAVEEPEADRSAAEDTLEWIGKRVMLRSGGPLMMVVKRLVGDRVACCWFDDEGTKQTGEFEIANLVFR